MELICFLRHYQLFKVMWREISREGRATQNAEHVKALECYV